MVISFSDAFSSYQNTSETAKIRKAVSVFQNTIETGPYSQDFTNIVIEIDVDDNAEYKGKSVPAVSPVDSSSSKWIKFNVIYCSPRMVNHYLALLAHEVGHMYPTWQTSKDDLFEDIVDETDRFVIRGILNPRKELIADYYACKLGFYSDIVGLRKLTDSENNRFDEYMDALESYRQPNIFRKKACTYLNK